MSACSPKVYSVANASDKQHIIEIEICSLIIRKHCKIQVYQKLVFMLKYVIRTGGGVEGQVALVATHANSRYRDQCFLVDLAASNTTPWQINFIEISVF